MFADTRRAARAAWEVAIARAPSVGTGVAAVPDLAVDPELAVDDDALYWLRVPVDQRARLTWDLSRELFVLAARNGGVFDEESGTFNEVERGDLERRLPRAAFRVTRR